MTVRKLANVVIFTLLVLTGCASKNNHEFRADPTIRSIAVIPVSDPSWFSLENRNAIGVVFPIVGVGNALDSRQKAKQFTEKMLSEKRSLGNDLTVEIVDALNQKGYQTTILEGVHRPEEDPEGIDYDTIESDADAVLHVYFTDVGVFSGGVSLDYLPIVNIYGYLFNPKNGQYIHEEAIYYGEDGREGKSWSVSADPEFAYRSFDELMKNSAAIMDRFGAGATAAGRRMAENIRAAMR